MILRELRGLRRFDRDIGARGSDEGLVIRQRKRLDPGPTIMSFVRGELGWQLLEPLGVRIRFSDDGCDVEGGAGTVVAPSMADVGRGLIANLGKSPRHVQQWAAVLLAGSSFVDLSSLERDSDGEALLEGLWEASARNPLDDRVVALATRLAHS
jgi:hypothetical protein